MEESKNVIQNNVLNGIVWDAKAIETIQTVATALLNLTELFKSQNIKIEAMIKIENQDNVKIFDNEIRIMP